MIRLEKKSLLTLILLLVLIGETSAQIQNSPFQNFKQFEKTDSSKLFFRFENLNFIKNNEYNSDFIDGATWIGYIASPKLIYYPSHNFRLEAGARLQKFSGRENFSASEPIFSAIYTPSEKLEFIMGALNQDNNHHLSLPIFDEERYFMDNAENGFQILYHTGRINLQTWINWEKFILENDPFQEKFTFGISGNIKLNRLSSNNSLSIPVELLFAHRGGEIDNSTGSVQTIGNFASGLQFTKTINNSRITSWTAKTIAYYFSDNSSEKEYIFDKGHAFYPQIGITTQKSSLELGYWNAYKFASSRGSRLFQSVSYKDPTYYEKRRELITLNYYYEQKITNGIHLGGKFDLFYDLANSKENLSTAIYLKINGDFFLKKIKWNN